MLEDRAKMLAVACHAEVRETVEFYAELTMPRYTPPVMRHWSAIYGSD